MKVILLGAALLVVSFLVETGNAKCSYRNKSVTTEQVITLVPLGKVRQSVIADISDTLAVYFGATIRIGDRLPLPAHAFRKGLKRYDATTILKYMDVMHAETQGKVLGITESDISYFRDEKRPNYGVLGLGTLGGKTAVVSTVRIKSKPNLQKLAIHEVLHTHGLNHCKLPSCVMSSAGKDANRRIAKQTWLCSDCKKQLQIPVL